MSRLRSPGYPSASLPVALEFAEKIYTQNRVNAIDREAAAISMGYSGSSGASDKTIANLTHYGLLQKADKGEIRVTQLAVDILRPENEREKAKSVQKAAFNPQLFTILRSKFPDGHFSSDAVKNTLSRLGFQEIAILPASKAYSDTCQYLKQLNAYDDFDQVSPVEDLEIGNMTFGRSEAINEEATQQFGGAVPPFRNVATSPVVEASAQKLQGMESEWMRNKVGPETTVTIVVSGEMGPKEIGKLIRLLEAQKSVLEDD
jgi:hypothetical protein